MARKILIGSAAIVLLFNLFFFSSHLQIGWGVFFLLINIYFFLVRDKSKYVRLGVLAGVLSTSFGFLNGVYDNEAVQFFNLVAALFLSGASLYFYKLKTTFPYDIPETIFAPLRVISTGVHEALTYLSSNPWSKVDKKSETRSGVIRGILISIPVAIILLVLFGNADPIFGKFLGNIFKVPDHLLPRIILSGILFTILFSFGFATIALHAKEKITTIKESKFAELVVIIGILSVILFAFIFFQASYLFETVGELELYKLGTSARTYSEHLRRGFAELTFASIILGFVLLYIKHAIQYVKDLQQRIIKIGSVIMTVGIGLLLVSALQRLIVQVDTHGLSEIRIFGYVFLAWLITTISALLAQILWKIKNEYSFSILSGSTILALLVLNFISIDYLIAVKNPPTVNNQIDYAYLAGRGAGAHETWDDIIANTEKEIKNLETKDQLTDLDSQMIPEISYTLFRLENTFRMLISKYGSEDQIKSSQAVTVVDNGLTSGRNPVAYNFTEKRAYDAKLKDGVLYKKVQDLSARTSIIQNALYNRTSIPSKVSEASSSGELSQ